MQNPENHQQTALERLDLDELLLLAFHHRIIDDGWVEDGNVYIQIGNQHLAFDVEAEGRFFILGLLRGYQRTLHIASETS